MKEGKLVSSAIERLKKQSGPSAAIKLKCIDCMGGYVDKVSCCTMVECSLFSRRYSKKCIGSTCPHYKTCRDKK